MSTELSQQKSLYLVYNNPAEYSVPNSDSRVPIYIWVGKNKIKTRVLLCQDGTESWICHPKLMPDHRPDQSMYIPGPENLEDVGSDKVNHLNANRAKNLHDDWLTPFQNKATYEPITDMTAYLVKDVVKIGNMTLNLNFGFVTDLKNNTTLQQHGVQGMIGLQDVGSPVPKLLLRYQLLRKGLIDKTVSFYPKADPGQLQGFLSLGLDFIHTRAPEETFHWFPVVIDQFCWSIRTQIKVIVEGKSIFCSNGPVTLNRLSSGNLLDDSIVRTFYGNIPGCLDDGQNKRPEQYSYPADAQTGIPDIEIWLGEHKFTIPSEKFAMYAMVNETYGKSTGTYSKGETHFVGCLQSFKPNCTRSPFGDGGHYEPNQSRHEIVLGKEFLKCVLLDWDSEANQIGISQMKGV